MKTLATSEKREGGRECVDMLKLVHTNKCGRLGRSKWGKWIGNR